MNTNILAILILLIVIPLKFIAYFYWLVNATWFFILVLLMAVIGYNINKRNSDLELDANKKLIAPVIFLVIGYMISPVPAALSFLGSILMIYAFPSKELAEKQKEIIIDKKKRELGELIEAEFGLDPYEEFN